MYHVPNDKRSKSSAFRIYQSVRHILWEKELINISILDIYHESNIARTTFYRLFDNINDVLEYQLEIYFNEYMELRKNENDKILFFFNYFDMHSDLIYIISTQCEHILYSVMNKIYDNSNEYLISIKIGIFTSLLCCWVKNKKKETPFEMSNITKKLLSSNNIINIITEI